MKCAFFVFVTLSVIVSYNLCEETPTTDAKPNLSEERRLISEEKSEDEEKKVEPLLEIDKDIKAELKSPTGLDTSFEVQLKILKHIVDYYKRLVHLYNGVKDNISDKLEFAKGLVKQGGPTFLKEDINEEKLKQVYNWDDANLEFFQDYMSDIKAVWNNITVSLDGPSSPN